MLQSKPPNWGRASRHFKRPLRQPGQGRFPGWAWQPLEVRAGRPALPGAPPGLAGTWEMVQPEFLFMSRCAQPESLRSGPRMSDIRAWQQSSKNKWNIIKSNFQHNCWPNIWYHLILYVFRLELLPHVLGEVHHLALGGDPKNPQLLPNKWKHIHTQKTIMTKLLTSVFAFPLSAFLELPDLMATS